MTDIRRFDALDSTNAEASRLAEKSERGPLWVVAASQTKGRGRRGRTWISKPGNLFASLLAEIDAPLETCGQLSFVAALAVGDLVSFYASDGEVTLKWPNDILLNRRKIAGILVEASSSGAASRIIVGCGVNLANHPDETEFPATSLADVIGYAPDPEAALERLVARWGTWYESWRVNGFEPIRAAWLAQAGGLGGKLIVHLADSEIEGVFENLSDDGALLLRVNGGGFERITAGDVFFSS